MTRHLGNAALARNPTVRADSGSGSPPTVPKPRVLLVDDEPLVLEGLALHLRRKYEVVTRTSGALALEALADGSFMAVISDLRMPQMDGIQLLATMRKRAPMTMRVLLTGFADVASSIAAVNEAGVHRFLTKPCPPAQLARALEEVLASASTEDDAVDEQMTVLGRQATLGTMAGSIGHEIGNLVAALASSLELVQAQVARGEVPTSEDIGLLGLVKNRLQEHARALKELSRPQQRAIENIDVGTLVCATVEMLKRAGVLKGTRVEVDLPPSPLHIDADRGLIEGMLINLLKNAAEALVEKDDAAMRAGVYDDEIPVVTIGLRPRGEEAVTLFVEDNGRGVARENLAKLWKPHFTTKTRTGGTGLGLAIVRETVTQHGGRVDVASTVGRGTRFTVELPLSGQPSLLGAASDARATGCDDVPGGSVIRLFPRNAS